MEHFNEAFMSERPKTRGECQGGERPCPRISCEHHMLWALISDKAPHRFFKKTDDEIVDIIFSLKETCVLDVADRGGVTLDEIGQILGITRERTRQIEGTKRGGALNKIKRHSSKHKFLVDWKPIDATNQ
jgi:hypothetical protein